MVRNIDGGSRHKSQARKNIVSNKTSTTIRLIENEGECYAHVEKILGGANMHVLCTDGKTRLCHIRGKFRGRGKRDNQIEAGTMVMVGIRDYETIKDTGTKLENCDLLEVYKHDDKKRLYDNIRQTEDLTKFIERDNERAHIAKETMDIVFVTKEDEQREQMIQESKQLSNSEKHNEKEQATKIKNIEGLDGIDDDIDIDDI